MLIATDLASRGIDVADISHIINYDIPEDPEVYVHRVGRTARMGAKGKAFTFIARDQGDELTRIESLINMVIQPVTLEGFEPTPPPADWTGPEARRRQVRFQTGAKPICRPYSPGAPRSVATALPPRTIGSKIPINRRHRRRR